MNQRARTSKQLGAMIRRERRKQQLTQAQLGQEIGLREDQYKGDPVIAVFDNLLPDNSQIRVRLAERTKAGGTDVFSLLTALLYFDDAWQVPRGSTATTHILKPQIGLRGNLDLSQSVENEYLCMTLTAELGLPTAEVSIEDFENQRPFVIQFLVE